MQSLYFSVEAMCGTRRVVFRPKNRHLNATSMSARVLGDGTGAKDMKAGASRCARTARVKKGSSLLTRTSTVSRGLSRPEMSTFMSPRTTPRSAVRKINSSSAWAINSSSKIKRKASLPAGTTQCLFDPQHFIARLAALVPCPQSPFGEISRIICAQCTRASGHRDPPQGSE
jgi:hypothetical protein